MLVTKRVYEADGKTVRQECTVEYDFGDNLDAAVEKFGEEAVFRGYVAAAKIALQGVMGNNMAKEKSDEEIQNLVDEWIYGAVTQTRKTMLEKAMDQVGKMSPDEKAAFLARLKEDAE